MRGHLIGPAILICCSTLFAQRQPQGISARPSPSDYSASVTVSGVTYAASAVPAKQLKHLFAFDISRDYVVLEVALYPSTSKGISLAPERFLLRTSEPGGMARPADSTTVASVIQQKNLPRPSSHGGSTVTTAATVGYESGRDPYTGQRVHGTYTATQVGISTGDDGPPPPVRPGASPQDRELLEHQLWDRSLPSGQIRQPAAGYLYFPRSDIKKKGNGTYQLQYSDSQTEPVLNGGKSPGTAVLQIPLESH